MVLGILSTHQTCRVALGPSPPGELSQHSQLISGHAEVPHQGRMHLLGEQGAGERLVGMKHLKGMGAGRLDQATGAAARSPGCTLEPLGSLGYTSDLLQWSLGVGLRH